MKIEKTTEFIEDIPGNGIDWWYWQGNEEDIKHKKKCYLSRVAGLLIIEDKKVYICFWPEKGTFYGDEISWIYVGKF